MFGVANLACHRLSVIGPESERMNNDGYVRDLDRHVADWARRHHTAGRPDTRLCTGGYHDAIDGVTLYDDDLHFSSRSAVLRPGCAGHPRRGGTTNEVRRATVVGDSSRRPPRLAS